MKTVHQDEHKLSFDADTFWKRGKAYFFSPKENHTAIVIPMGDHCIVAEYWKQEDGSAECGMGWMEKAMSDGFQILAEGLDYVLDNNPDFEKQRLEEGEQRLKDEDAEVD
jgi:hypothetical protein